MNRIRGIVPTPVGIPKVRKIGRKSVAVQKNSVLCVNLADSHLETAVEVNQSRVLGVAWLINEVVPRDPRVVFIMLSKFLPKPNNSILEVAMIPQGSIVSRVV